MKSHINNLHKYVKSNFIFFNSCVDILGNDIYFCSCGQKNVSHPNESSYAVQVEDINQIDSSHLETAFRKANIVCPGCQKNYTTPEVYTTIQNLDTDFLDKYELKEDKNNIVLHKYRVSTAYDKENINFSIFVSDSYISISKKTKKIKFKEHPSSTRIAEIPQMRQYLSHSDFEKEIETIQTEQKVNLSDVVSISKKFFANGQNTQITEGFINVHDFIGRCAKLIIDSKNMNIIDELMNQMIGKSGVNILQKVLAIFMGIMCYPNLSTIALTKGNGFLYDLMERCKLPDTKYLQNKEATSPLKIFNALIILKNNDLQKKMDQDDSLKLGYVFKSKSGVEFNIKYETKELGNIEKANAVSLEGAKMFVRDNILNQKISPYIFNTLRTFADYESVIQWLIFVSFNDLINLVMKYDIELLNNVYKKIEFRDDINIDRIQQFISIMISYAEKEMSKEYSLIKNKVNLRILNNENKNYEAIKFFDFALYDDCMRMIVELGWDPNKVLYKTKNYEKLGKLHENLVKFRGYISDKDANQKYIDFSKKFSYLEGNHTDKKGRFSFEVKIISTPAELLNSAVEMHNCAGSYINKVANGQYVPFLVYDNSAKRKADEYYKYMMVLEVTKYGLEFVGIKSYCNQYGTDRFKTSVTDFLIENDISFKDVPSIKLGVQSSELSYSGTFEKVEKINTPSKQIKGNYNK